MKNSKQDKEKPIRVFGRLTRLRYKRHVRENFPSVSVETEDPADKDKCFLLSIL